MGEDLCAPSCIAARIVQSPGGVLLLGPSFIDCTGRHCSDHAFFGPVSWSPESGEQPMGSTFTLWWLKFQPTGGGSGAGGGGGGARPVLGKDGKLTPQVR